MRVRISSRLAGSLIAVLLITAAPSAVPAAPDVSSFKLAVWPSGAPSPNFALVDTDALPRTLGSYRGRVVIVYFGFLRCPDACPTGLTKLAAVMKELGDGTERVQVLFITLDPMRDTPAELKSYLAAFDSRFVGLTGTEAQVDRAAQSFNVQYSKVIVGGDYTISHSAATYIFDANGSLRLVGGERSRAADFVHDLSVLLAEQSVGK
jgi:protein SCO1/2